MEYSEKAKDTRNAIYSNVGHALCEIRKGAGYTLEEAASMVGYKKEKLQKIEDGGHVSIPAFMRIIATFGGHVYVESKTGTYSLEELSEVPPITQEEIDSLKLSKENDRIVRNKEWLHRMADKWGEEE